MDIEQIRQYALNKNNVEETLPFGPDTLVFKTNGKIFLLLSLDEEPLRFNVKCNPDYAIELREKYTSVIPGYHMNKKHWNTIIINGELPTKLILSFIDDSYNLVNPKKKV
ncbi:MAG: MmcQ/YjbR family DNA-binding protein [Bacteroidetes bacterium]|nr:MmcQ/YjbR family DNA-binding protein [Bacteroidota bacterium]MBS1591198.1 MmcQ/YjbR family DNA-binding protein [Bacteroidota bacterium]MBS1641883.1 MmcQ/YjbR family DNA-binding protein [Bacteroidota bacterium]MBS1670672.1 MmcQ/YjbR family DNA-binding protein [Bacteroidota bacterium]